MARECPKTTTESLDLKRFTGCLVCSYKSNDNLALDGLLDTYTVILPLSDKIRHRAVMKRNLQ
jgi:hypothetical protein